MSNTGFRYERDMVAPAAAWLASRGLTLRREFSTPWGICDLVAASLNSQHVDIRIKLGQKSSIGPIRRVALLHRIPENRAITLGRLKREYGTLFDDSELTAELHKLVAGKFVRTPRAGLFQKVNGWVPLHDDLVAVELKLARVGEVLHQAIGHLEFATESYVGLPPDVARRALQSKRHIEFSDAGVGLLSVSRKGCEVLIAPGPSDLCVNSVAQMYLVERFWRSLIRDK